MDHACIIGKEPRMPTALPLDQPARKVPFILYTVTAAAITAAATWASVALHYPVWVVFVGFIAWYVRPTSMLDSLYGVVCLWSGIAMAILSALATRSLLPITGAATLALVVFVVAVMILSLRSTKVLDNLICWFLGLVTYYGMNAPLAPAKILLIAAATGLGALTGWLCQITTQRWSET